MTTELEFWVIGDAAPQGSKRHVGHGVMVESSKKVKPWRQDVAAAARDAADAAGWQPLPQVRAEILFTFPRPASHYGTGRNANTLKPGAPHFHSNKPDVDKLQRSTFDALKTAGVILDDSKIVAVHACKIWADRGQKVGAFILLAVPGNPSTQGETA